MALHWKLLDNSSGIEQIKLRSQEIPCLIFKHSHRCEICNIAKYRLEDDWDFAPDEMEAWFLDVIQHRPVSQEVASTFQVHHESPQILLILDGECIHDASHLDITLEEIKSALNYAKN